MPFQRGRLAFCSVFAVLLAASLARGDGKVMGPRFYQGSLEESSQEAIIIFQASEEEAGSFEDLILKIDVRGKTDQFAWVIPFPKEPKVQKEDAQLFQELHSYVEHRLMRRGGGSRGETADNAKAKDGRTEERPVEVISRKIVGSYDVAVVRENQAGALNRWLEEEKFQPLPADAEDVIGFYREKGYVFACVKVKDATPGDDGNSALHPLRFSFRTGGYDGIYFPMKMTGLQTMPFDVNLYVFHRYWINDKLSKHGYVHRGFSLKYRDWDSPQCEPNAGKQYSAPGEDLFLRYFTGVFPTLTTLFQKLHPGERYYLTNIQAHGLKPADVRQWSDDLWLFPYYTDKSWTPRDARAGGIASTSWPIDATAEEEDVVEPDRAVAPSNRGRGIGVGLAALVVCLAGGAWIWRRRSPSV